MKGPLLAFLIALLSMSSQIYSFDEWQLNAAATYAEAGDPAHAQSILDALADPSMDEWKHRRISYDAGTAYLFDGDWKNALLKLLPLASEEVSSPLPVQRLSQNIAYARMLEVEELWKSIENQSDVSEDFYYALLIKLGQASGDVERGRKTLCSLQKAEGSVHCPSSTLYDDMEREIHRLHAAVFEAYTGYRLIHATPQSAVPELLASAKVFKEMMLSMLEVEGNNEWHKAYGNAIHAQMETWFPLWEQTGYRWNGKIDKRPYEKGYGLFRESYHSLENDDIRGAIEAIGKSADSLSEMLDTLYSAASPHDAVITLLAAYKLALIKDPIQYSSLAALQGSLRALSSLLGKSSGGSAAPLLADAEKYLLKGLEAYRNESNLSARIYTEASMSFVESLERQLSPPSKSSGEDILKQILAMQEYVNRITLLRLQSSTDESDFKDVDALIADLQSGVLLTALSFPQASMNQQRMIYDDTGSKEDKCQCSPWDEVVPLFDEGFLNARQAGSAFSDISSRVSVPLLQEKAVQYWKDALAALHEKKKNNTNERDQEKSGQPGNEDNSLHDVLRYIQEMDLDDRSWPQTIAPMGGREAERPW